MCNWGGGTYVAGHLQTFQLPSMKNMDKISKDLARGGDKIADWGGQ